MKNYAIILATCFIAACSHQSSSDTNSISQTNASHEVAPRQEGVICDENANRYANEEEARAAGFSDAQFGATYCPEYKMHPSWDRNNDGVNDCVSEGNCNGTTDYMSPRP